MASTRVVITECTRHGSRVSESKNLEYLLQEIEENKNSLKKVNLINCSVGAGKLEEFDSFVQVMTLLHGAPLVEEINLSRNSLSSYPKQTAVLLADLPRLQVLNLSDNHFSYSDIKNLIETVMGVPRPFKFILNGLTLIECHQLRQDFIDKRSLQLDFLESKESLEAKEGFYSVLRELKNKPVKKLNLAACKIGNVEVRSMVEALDNQVFFLKEVDLSDNNITSVGADTLYHLYKKIPELKINLSGNPISSKELEYKNLKKEVISDIAAHFVIYPITKLKVVSANVDDKEVEQLARFLENNLPATLTDIDLWENKITDTGADILFNLTKKFPHLKINVNKNPISARELEYKDDSSRELMAKLNYYPVSKLKVSDAIWQSEFKKMIELIESCQLTTLVELDLSENKIVPEAEALLLRLKTVAPHLKIKLPVQDLEYKQIDCSKKHLDTVLNKLRLYPISKLKINDCKLSCDEVKRLVTEIKNYQPTLTELDLSNLSDKEIKEHFKNTIDNECVKELTCLFDSKLQKLNLSNNVIGDKGAIAIAKALPSSKVNILDVSGNRIFDDGLCALKEVKRVEINLKDNSIPDQDDDWVIAENVSIPSPTKRCCIFAHTPQIAPIPLEESYFAKPERKR